MQLTARQREFAGIDRVGTARQHHARRHLRPFPKRRAASVWGYIQGAVTAILISCHDPFLEFAVFSRARNALARRVPFLLYLALRSLGYLAAILMGLAVGAWLVRESAASAPLIERGGVIFSLIL